MKKIAICLLVFLFAGPVLAFAHTELEESTPRDGATVEEPIEELELMFSTELEEQSTVELAQENGETIPVSVTVEGSGLTASLNETLATGNYTANWLVVGEDGHPVEGRISFEVTGQAAEEETASQHTDTDSTEENTQADNQVNQQASSESGEQGISTGLLIILGIIVGLLLLSGIWLARRKK